MDSLTQDPLAGFVISQADGRPMYRQVMEQIKVRVAAGDWQPEQMIPSIRELAVALKVSVITIKRAYLELEREGVIVTMQGKGSFVAADGDLGAKLHSQELDDHLDKAVHVAALSGVDLASLVERVRAAWERSQRNQP